MRNDWFSCRLFRMALYGFFAAATVLLAGSLSPERLTVYKVPDRPAVETVLGMMPELPRERQKAWAEAADRDAVTLFRLTCSGR